MRYELESLSPARSLCLLADSPSLQPHDIVEVPLLLSGQQMFDLEEVAHRSGLTAGELLRRMLKEFVLDALRQRG